VQVLDVVLRTVRHLLPVKPYRPMAMQAPKVISIHSGYASRFDCNPSPLRSADSCSIFLLLLALRHFVVWHAFLLVRSAACPLDLKCSFRCTVSFSRKPLHFAAVHGKSLQVGRKDEGIQCSYPMSPFSWISGVIGASLSFANLVHSRSIVFGSTMRSVKALVMTLPESSSLNPDRCLMGACPK
jgi:hypothetical protein